MRRDCHRVIRGGDKTEQIFHREEILRPIVVRQFFEGKLIMACRETHCHDLKTSGKRMVQLSFAPPAYNMTASPDFSSVLRLFPADISGNGSSFFFSCRSAGEKFPADHLADRPVAAAVNQLRMQSGRPKRSSFNFIQQFFHRQGGLYLKRKIHCCQRRNALADIEQPTFSTISANVTFFFVFCMTREIPGNLLNLQKVCNDSMWNLDNTFKRHCWEKRFRSEQLFPLAECYEHIPKTGKN